MFNPEYSNFATWTKIHLLLRYIDSILFINTNVYEISSKWVMFMTCLVIIRQYPLKRDNWKRVLSNSLKKKSDYNISINSFFLLKGLYTIMFCANQLVKVYNKVLCNICAFYYMHCCRLLKYNSEYNFPSSWTIFETGVLSYSKKKQIYNSVLLHLLLLQIIVFILINIAEYLKGGLWQFYSLNCQNVILFF